MTGLEILFSEDDVFIEFAEKRAEVFTGSTSKGFCMDWLETDAPRELEMYHGFSFMDDLREEMYDRMAMS